MQQGDYLTKLLGFQGFTVKRIKTEREGEIDRVVIELDRTEKRYRCSSYREEVSSQHSSWMQEVNHLHL